MKQLSGAKMKHYTTLISKAKFEREQLSQEYRTLQSKMDKANNLIEKYENELAKLTSTQSTLVVSEHALLRYLERVYKLDLLKIEAEIASSDLLSKVSKLGNGTYSSGEGYSAKVVDGVVVTILDEANQHTTPKKKKSVRDRSTLVKPKLHNALQRDLEDYYRGRE